jgi:4-coumarate--CoA ligase
MQINPSEIESVIESIQGVAAVSVISVPDPIALDLPAAVIVKMPGFEKLTEEIIKKTVADRLPDRKHLRGGVYFIDKMPMTGSGKIQKRIVKEIAIKLYNKGNGKGRD